jgi:siderophore-iron reductase FhuF
MARTGAGNPLLGIGTGTGLPAALLCAPTPGEEAGGIPARHLVDAVGAWLAQPERRVAASLVVLGYAARLVGPTLALLLREDVLLDVRPAQVHYSYAPRAGFVLTVPHPSGQRARPDTLRRAWCETVIDEHLGPLIHAVRAVVPVATGLLWGNVASGITGALRTLADPGPVPLNRCHDTGLALLDYGPLRGSGHLVARDGQLRFRRRSCCLYYRLDGGGTCGDCPLPPYRSR